MIVDIVNGQKVPRYLIYDIVKYAVSRSVFVVYFFFQKTELLISSV